MKSRSSCFVIDSICITNVKAERVRPIKSMCHFWESQWRQHQKIAGNRCISVVLIRFWIRQRFGSAQVSWVLSLGWFECCVAWDQEPPDHHAKFDRKLEQIHHRKFDTAVQICSNSNLGPDQRLFGLKYVSVFTSFLSPLRVLTMSCRWDNLELVTWILDLLKTSCDRGFDRSRSCR
jgi:hypothetical protein